jgi:hypothetical protein
LGSPHSTPAQAAGQAALASIHSKKPSCSAWITSSVISSLSGDARMIQLKMRLCSGSSTFTMLSWTRHAQVLHGVSRAKAVKSTPDRWH